MPVRRLVLFLALALATLGGSALAAGVGPAAPTTVNLAGGGGAAPTTELPDLTFGDASVDETTTTTSTPPATTSTAKPATTATTSALTTATTALPVSPTTTSTTPPPTTAVIRVKNDYSSAVKLTIGDVNENQWILEPGEEAGPWTLETATDHGDYMTVTAVGTQCGAGDGEDYFHGGGDYVLTVQPSSLKCGDTPAPRVQVHNRTTNSTWWFNDPNTLPRTG